MLTSTTLETVKHGATAIGAVVAVMVIIWNVGEPHAENMIVKIMDSKKYATQLQMKHVKNTVDSNARRARDVQIEQVKQKETLVQVKELLQEQRTDFKDLLRELRTQNRNRQ